MTVSQLIAELQRHHPQKPVRVVLSQVLVDDEIGDAYIELGAESAADADDVRDEGAFVLVRGR